MRRRQGAFRCARAIPRPGPAGERRGPLEQAIERERYEQQRAQLLSLPARQRQLLGLHGAGLTYEEIAERTGDSRRTVERQLLRGRARLR
ncbi:MAG: RNA polymerase sigma factor [Solirubrobacteraceae bacterium]